MSEIFDLTRVLSLMTSALDHENGDVEMQGYLDSFAEFNRFFHLMGTIFTFVSSELQSKMDVLQAFLNSNNSEHFKSVITMIEYEKKNGLLEKKGYVSGSRTLLRLHRALDFIRKFLQYVYDLCDEDHTNHVCTKAYNETLAKHHSFFIATGARVAMYYMPTKQNLLQTVCGNDACRIQTTVTILPETLQVLGKVYDVIDGLYSKYNLHLLP